MDNDKYSLNSCPFPYLENDEFKYQLNYANQTTSHYYYETTEQKKDDNRLPFGHPPNFTYIEEKSARSDFTTIPRLSEDSYFAKESCSNAFGSILNREPNMDIHNWTLPKSKTDAAGTYYFNGQVDSQYKCNMFDDYYTDKSQIMPSGNDVRGYNHYEDYTCLSSLLNVTEHNIFSCDINDQQTEVSNGESDIIVEETDDDVTDFSEEPEKKTCQESSKCVICNTPFTPIGTQFYCLTLSSPVTMTSQQPVFLKLKRLIGKIKSKNNQICSDCLGLLNSVDHFQTKFENFKNELLNKFRKTCQIRGLKPDKRKLKRTIIPDFRCKFCKKILSFKYYCISHIRKHRQKNILCEKCGFLSTNRKVFRKHSCNSSVLADSIHFCSNCQKHFKSKIRLKEHENFCLGTLPYVCQNLNCSKKFATKTRLKNHIKLKHDKKFVAICSICNIGFVKLSDYKSHKITHSTDKKFQCQQCNKSYKTSSNLNFHMKSHQENLPFLCSLCGKGFMRKEYLETHVNHHKGIKNFVCTICSKQFVSQKNLDSHLKHHDGKIRKKICNICGKALTTNLNEHLRIHTNMREFECNICELRFNTKGTLLKHRKIKHSS